MIGAKEKKERDYERLIFWKERGQIKEYAELMFPSFLENLVKIADRHNEFEISNTFQSVIDKMIEEKKEREKPLPFEYLDKIKSVDLKDLADLRKTKHLTFEESTDALNYKVLSLFSSGRLEISGDLEYLTRLYKESIRFQLYELSKMVQLEIDKLNNK